MRTPSIRSAMWGGVSRLWARPSVMFLIVAAGVLTSFLLDWRQTERNVESVARERGAALFRLVELTRNWNARHGGVYVPVTPETQPNPYLDHPRRDLITRDGQQLTMVNPAFMTRQIAEIAQQAEGFRLHITSLRPIRPANGPDDWEAAALHRFEAGTAEVIELIPGAAPVHRYMAPLRVTEPCMPCHRSQGYEIGQIRGGISVTMPAAELLTIRDADRVRSASVHLLMFAVIAALLHLLAASTRRHVQELERLTREQDRVIGERTHALTTANEQLEQQLADRELAAAVFQNAAEGIVVTDERGAILQVNPGFVEITGYAAEELLGRRTSMLDSGRHPPEFFAAMREALAREGRWRGEVWSRRKSGELFASAVSISRASGGGQPVRLVTTMTDITHSKEEEERLRHRAYHDPLTDLPNRALFADRLGVAFSQAQRHDRQFALCYLDLDRFKPVNDQYGHAAGDDLLVETARRLRLCVRAVDTVARLGGDEFAAILTEIGSRKEVEDIAARMVTELARPFRLRAGDAQISCSMGIAIYPEHGENVDILTQRADEALYAVKQSGRNAFRIGTDPAPR